jgi:hypothetical protein
LAKTALKTAGITRAAFDYQDLIGIEVLIDFFRNPARYAWVELESEDRAAGYLDDVVALRKDGKFEYTQVKFTVDPDRYPLSWDWLLESKAHGTSRLKKWANSLSTYDRSGGIGRAELRTNRTPDIEFAKGLYGNKVRPNNITSARRAEVERELGGAAEARAFFKQFHFRHSEIPDVPGLEQRLKATIVPTDTTSDGCFFGSRCEGGLPKEDSQSPTEKSSTNIWCRLFPKKDQSQFRRIFLCRKYTPSLASPFTVAFSSESRKESRLFLFYGGHQDAEKAPTSAS